MFLIEYKEMKDTNHMGRPKKVKPEVNSETRRQEIHELINSFNFSYSHLYSESFIRTSVAEITKAVIQDYGKYFKITEEIAEANAKPPFFPSWKIEAKI